MRRAAALLAVPVVLASCGGSSAPQTPRERVHLRLDEPGDRAVVREREVAVSGRVSPPTASVLVRGQRVAVTAGRFRTRVGLDAGTNVIDVVAGARDARAAMTALRVQRQVTVRVPDLEGDDPRDARERLAGLGLRAEIEDAGGPFDALLPGDPAVCESDPAAGDQVDAGATVKLLVARGC